ncbi:GNAT family N-acetyltransferase [Halorarius litoreus]|uniref:GNAT family N-acetyltransferase n=1 Tax=Halorarius litoreus TaxID=2962676 RepID=UPI0020CEC9DE|nr:GNAT family N-acetyltransferase [Halorarius litoreus]
MSADRPAVRELQKLLDVRAPALLEAAFDAGLGEVLVADAGGEALVGYALAVPGDESAEPSIVYLAELVVAPGVRRQGWGTALLDAVCAELDGYDQLRLTVREDDTAARAFYRDRGFWELADLPDHFDGEDGRLLVRDLA